MNDTSQILKPSLYNMFFYKKDGIAVYNTRIGHMIRSFEENAIKVEKILNSKEDIVFNECDDILVKLYKQGFIINKYEDEISDMEKIEKISKFNNYLTLIILPTEYCNFQCVYCYEYSNRGKMSKKVQERIVQSVEQQIDNYDGLIVNWFGGEPLEAFDVIENLSVELLRICKAHKKPYNAGITTNGYNLTVEKVRILKKFHVTEYQITLDGIPAIHNKQRILKNGGETAEKIIENLINIKNEIKSSMITIVLRTNFSKELMSHLDEFQDLLDTNFADDSRFNFFWQMVGDYGYVHDDSVRNIFGSKYDYFYLIKNCTKRFVSKYMLQLYGPAGSVCYALKRNALVISSDGVIKKCTCDLEKPENCFGEIGKFFDYNKHEEWLNREISIDSKCYLCLYRPICHNRACYKAKGCLINLEHVSSILDLISEDKKYYVVI